MHPFDDDDTIDFSYEIKREGLTALARACKDARYSDSREEQHAEGFAAAFIVASIITKDAEAVNAKTLELKPTKQLIEADGAAPGHILLLRLLAHPGGGVVKGVGVGVAHLLGHRDTGQEGEGFLTGGHLIPPLDVGDEGTG
jgi:hypothetical protein